MKLPVIRGTIKRRILVNYRVDPQVIQRVLPQTFRPKLHNGYAIAGICLIRLEDIRPRFIPRVMGISSENAAHRIAVTWTDPTDSLREGVFIPRRDTSNLLNHVAGGRIFPGEHNLAKFEVRSTLDTIDFSMRSKDGQVHIRFRATRASCLPTSSSFNSVEEASHFFEPGSLGYSVTKEADRLDGIILSTKNWHVEPVNLEDIHSSYFANENIFPKGSADFDCALLMENIDHEWHTAENLYT